MGTLRKWFGPSKKEIWQKLSLEIGANYVPGSFWKGDRVEVSHGEWIITLDTYAVTTGKATIVYTRLRAPYVNPDHFRFTIYRHGFFSEIGKWFGMQDIEVGYPSFDRDFVIKGTDPVKARALFDNERIRELISAQPYIHLTVKDKDSAFRGDFPADTDELCFHVSGIIKDPERLRQLFELFAETLDQLCKIGSAYEEAPKFKI